MNDFNFFDLDMFAKGTPYEAFKYLRKHEPVSWHSMPAPLEHQGFWLVTKYKDICEIGRQPKIFFSNAGTILEDTIRSSDPMYAMANDGLAHLDDPNHSKLRRPLMPMFSTSAMKNLKDSIRGRVVDILDQAEKLKTFDFVEIIATPLPVRAVYQDILGIDEEDLGAATLWGELFNRVHCITAKDREYYPIKSLAGSEFVSLYEYGVKAFRLKRDVPTDDILSVIANMKFENSGPITEKEFLSYYWSLMIGAFDTTASALATAAHELSTNHEQADKLYSNVSFLDRAVDEMIRWDTPVNYFRRTASKDYELNGQLIRKNDRVVMCFASGNRDEDVFENPDVFNIERERNKHLSFGHGQHFCLGSGLAHLEIRTFFEEVINRDIKFDVTGPIERSRSNFINRIVKMPVQIMGNLS